jgi:hypothetical protein
MNFVYIDTVEKLKKTLIMDAWNNMHDKCEFPTYGSPETQCSKCMFFHVACFPPRPEIVGCYGGWKIGKK